MSFAAPVGVTQKFDALVEQMQALLLKEDDGTKNGCTALRNKICLFADETVINQRRPVRACLIASANHLTATLNEIDPFIIRGFEGLALGGVRRAAMLYARESKEKEYDAFAAACSKNDLPKVKEFVEKHGLRPEYAIKAWGDKGQFLQRPPVKLTGLGIACANGADEVVDYLLSKGADPNFAIQAGSETPQEASTSGDLIIAGPYVLPAWLALLTSDLSVQRKTAIWNKLKGKADPMLLEGAEWWLSRCFLSRSAKPEELHAFLKGMKNLFHWWASRAVATQSAAPQTTKDTAGNVQAPTIAYTGPAAAATAPGAAAAAAASNTHAVEADKKATASNAQIDTQVDEPNFLHRSFYEAFSLLEVLREANAPALNDYQDKAWKEHCIKLGAVAICHGATVPDYFRDVRLIPEATQLKDWAAAAAMVKQKPLTLVSAEETYKQQKAQLQTDVLPLTDLDKRKDVLEEVADMTNNVVMLRDVIPTITNYLDVSPEFFKEMLADRCFEATFK